MPVPRRDLLEALDDTPQTVTGLSRRLDVGEDAVQETLKAAEEDGLAVDWGVLWATTWRAKLALSPDFFRLWIPMSLALGAALTALALGVNGPPSTPSWTLPLVVSIAAASALAGAWTLLDR